MNKIKNKKDKRIEFLKSIFNYIIIIFFSILYSRENKTYILLNIKYLTVLYFLHYNFIIFYCTYIQNIIIFLKYLPLISYYNQICYISLRYYELFSRYV